ncbi:Subtilisin-like protease [Quillaja saponaria]|uniref:Subtilisin-like protease n=1 Tax=Quillaja saponaria TaxID=32244 RepID=A0AAD7LHI6_QUISA|nr:Subtilisin-like protease [Quillaja saponaria]
MATHIPFCLWLTIITIPHLVSTLAQHDNYIIHMDLLAMPKAFSGYHSWYLATLSSVLDNSDDLSAKHIYTYSNVMNGFSASLSPTQLEALKSSPGYISSIRDLPAKVDTTHSSQFIGLNHISGAWPASNYGKDVIIGLVDTGIWPESESFKDDGMSDIPSKWKGECESGTKFNSSLCNKKLIGARFFNKGLIAKNPNITITVNSTRDTEGHGTHTSTTAAGNYVGGASYFGYATGKAGGMAPLARVAMYKALWEQGSFASDVIAAIDQAITDGVDVISLSFGLDGIPLYEDPVAIATFAALERGIFVTTSAGNEGPFLETLHNGTPWVITVAASTVDRQFGGILTLGDEVSVSGLSLYPGNFPSSRIPVVFMGLCDNLNELIKVRNKIVVCEDKNDTLGDQVYNVTRAKVVAGVFISNSSDLELVIQSTFPVIFINPKDGEVVKDYIKSNSAPGASLVFKVTTLGTKPAPSVTSYSSRGPSQSCPFVLKPDITAPGSLILAAWPEKIPAVEGDSLSLFNNFNLLSGTSMSCPHIAGVAALLKGVHPDWSPAAIRSAIMTTSHTLDNTLSPITDIGNDNQPATPLALGAGHVNPNKAVDPGLIYDINSEDYVNLLCALNYSKNNIKTITRSALNNCSNPSLDLNYPSFIVFFNANDSASDPDLKTAKEFHRTVTNIGEGESTYSASVTTIEGFEINVIPNNLVFEQSNEKLSYTVRIRGPKLMKETVAFGYLTWEDGIHVVRSPIVVTSLRSELLSSQN